MDLQKAVETLPDYAIPDYAITFMDKYPKKNDILAQASVARDVTKILKLFDTLSRLRRVPPSSPKIHSTFQDMLFHTDEAGILMRVAQTSLITHADVIPNLNGSYTYMVDSGMSFYPSKRSTDTLFVTNMEVTVHIPFSEEIDIHCFETDNSILTKWDTCFKFTKVGEEIYKVKLPGFHKLDRFCINRLKLVFTAKLPKHLPINVLLEYDYVFLRFELSYYMRDILDRFSCVRKEGNLALKIIPAEQNKRPELYTVNELKYHAFSGEGSLASDIRSLVDKEKYIQESDDDIDKNKAERKKVERDWSPQNQEIQPINGNPDINPIAHVFSQYPFLLTEEDKIIIWSVHTITPTEYEKIEKRRNFFKNYTYKRDLLKRDDNMELLVKMFLIEPIQNIEVESVPVEGAPAPIIAEDPIIDENEGNEEVEVEGKTIIILHFRQILMQRIDAYINKYHNCDKKLYSRLFQRINTIFYDLNDLVGKHTSFDKMRIYVLDTVFERLKDTRRVELIKDSTGMFDMDQYDVVFAEKYDDSFGKNTLDYACSHYH